MPLRTFSPATTDMSFSFSASSIYSAKRDAAETDLAPRHSEKRHREVQAVCPPNHPPGAELLNLPRAVPRATGRYPAPPCTHLCRRLFLLSTSQEVPHVLLQPLHVHFLGRFCVLNRDPMDLRRRPGSAEPPSSRMAGTTPVDQTSPGGTAALTLNHLQLREQFQLSRTRGFTFWGSAMRFPSPYVVTLTPWSSAPSSSGWAVRLNSPVGPMNGRGSLSSSLSAA